MSALFPLKIVRNYPGFMSPSEAYERLKDELRSKGSFTPDPQTFAFEVYTEYLEARSFTTAMIEEVHISVTAAIESKEEAF